MSFNYYAEYIDMPDNTLHKTKKKLWENGEWVDRTYIRIPVGADPRGPGDLEKWCRETYGEPKLNGPWFKVAANIIMDEKVYVFWQLCK
jgi:hypothetical protein